MHVVQELKTQLLACWVKNSLLKKEQTKCRSSKEKDKQNDKEPEKENIDAQQFWPRANKCRFCGLNHAAGTN